MGTVSRPPLRRPPRGCPTAAAGLSAKGRTPPGPVTPERGTCGPRRGAGRTARGRRGGDGVQAGGNATTRRTVAPIGTRIASRRRPSPSTTSTARARRCQACRASAASVPAGTERRPRLRVGRQAQVGRRHARGEPGRRGRARSTPGTSKVRTTSRRPGDRQRVQQRSVGNEAHAGRASRGSRARRRRPPGSSSGPTTCRRSLRTDGAVRRRSPCTPGTCHALAQPGTLRTRSKSTGAAASTVRRTAVSAGHAVSWVIVTGTPAELGPQLRCPVAAAR